VSIAAVRQRDSISAGYDGAGRRIRRKVNGQTKAAVQNKLKDLHRHIDAGISRPAPSNYTLRRRSHLTRQAMHGLRRRSGICSLRYVGRSGF